MTLSDEYILSDYMPIASPEANVTIVQSRAGHQIFLRKDLVIYNPDLFLYLKEHPVRGMPRILHAIPDGNHMILIEEYISGKRLDTLLSEHYFQSEAQTAEFLLQLCAIVRQLHDAEPPIIHRDIKPENVILSYSGEVRLLDLDAAKQYVSGQEHDTVLIGTEGYAAPEQYGFGASSIQTDIYGLGILYQEILKGTDSCSRSSRRIISRCTRMEPGARYRDVYELAADLSVIARRPPQEADRPACAPFRFTPPGFRSGDPMHLALATLGYPALFLSGLLLPFPAGARTLGILLYYAYVLTLLFFSCNYLEIWNDLRLTKIRKPFRRALAVIAIDAGYTLLLLLFAFVLQTLF